MRSKGVSSDSAGLVSVFVLTIAGFLTRIYPLRMSQFPFNNDSMTECGIASEILSSGHLEFSPGTAWYGTHTVVMPIYDTMIAFVSGMLGMAPVECAQIMNGVIAMTTVGSLYLLGRLFSGSFSGGVVAGLLAVTMGTFVFTTASVWKETLGIVLFLLALLSYMRRDDMRFRVLTFAILMLVPFTHHLVAAVTFITFTFLLVWAWFYAIARQSVGKRHFYDSVMIGLPSLEAVLYYSVVAKDSFGDILSPLRILLLIAGFIALNLVGIVILSRKKHLKVSFAPFVGAALLALIVFDYLGFVFPYSPSATDAYLVLVLAAAYLVTLAWYGTEHLVENRGMLRAVQVALLIAPLAIVGVGFVEGFSLASHKILYRSFDFFDPFLFVGVSVAIVVLGKKRRVLYALIVAGLIVASCVSFPFAFESDRLLGIRHDTQGYEIDGILWIEEHVDNPKVISDERIGYIGLALAGFDKYSSLPHYLRDDIPISTEVVCFIEESWTTTGVNDYPNGLYVTPMLNYTLTLLSSNVFYVGGPLDDKASLFIVSEYGYIAVYGPPGMEEVDS